MLQNRKNNLIRFDDMTFMLNSNKTLTLKSCDMERKGHVCIPDKLETYNIVEIGTNAFADCSEITSVRIGKLIEIIGDLAFCGCKKLERVNNLNFARIIAKNAFKDCTSFQESEYECEQIKVEKVILEKMISFIYERMPSSMKDEEGSIQEKVFNYITLIE